MSLADVLSKSSGLFEIMPGFAGEYPLVQVRGLAQEAVWLCDYTAPGDPIIVGVQGRPDAPAQLLVLGRVGRPGPVEALVSVVPAGSDTVIVSAGGVDYTVTFAADLTLSPGDRVRLLWQGAVGTAICKVGVTAAAAVSGPSTPPPPAPSQSGELPVAAADSGTYSVGYGWNAYYRQNLYQGNGSPWGGPSDNRGSWFYGNGAGQLAGATVTGVQFRVPARKSAGASSSTVTIHLYLHTSPSKPGGDVSRVAGPVDVSLTPGYGGGWVGLPSSWGATLAAGGGISISGDPYAGLVGRGEDPESGQLKLTWQR